MLTNEEKIEFIINQLNNIEASIRSYTENSSTLESKGYVLEQLLTDCYNKKSIYIQELESLGGIWSGTP